MKRFLLLIALAGCLQIQFDEPLKVRVQAEQQETEEILVQQTFACNFKLSLDAIIENGTLELEVHDGLTSFYDESFNAENGQNHVEYDNTFRSTAPIEVTLLRDQFQGTIAFDVACN